MVLAEYEHAKRRGAKIYAEVVGFGMSSDAYHMTSPPDDGAGAARSMINALRNAGITPAKVAYINAHGTSTPAAEHAGKVMISSTKSTTGHLLGAAGVIEAIFSVLALRDQAIPPTINLDNPYEGCDLDYVPKEALQVKGMDYTLCNSFGFGGTNGSLVFRAI